MGVCPPWGILPRLNADNGIRLIAGLLVGLVVARYLGPERFGLLNYSSAFVSLLMPLVHFSRSEKEWELACVEFYHKNFRDGDSIRLHLNFYREIEVTRFNG